MPRTPVSFVLLGFCAASVLCACSTLKTTLEIRPDGVRERRQYNADDELVRMESYYVTDRGKKVLHGRCEKYSIPGSFGIFRTYEDGTLVETSWITVYH